VIITAKTKLAITIIIDKANPPLKRLCAAVPPPEILTREGKSRACFPWFYRTQRTLKILALTVS
jgi:hypothetical protein